MRRSAEGESEVVVLLDEDCDEEDDDNDCDCEEAESSCVHSVSGISGAALTGTGGTSDAGTKRKSGLHSSILRDPTGGVRTCRNGAMRGRNGGCGGGRARARSSAISTISPSASLLRRSSDVLSVCSYSHSNSAGRCAANMRVR